MLTTTEEEAGAGADEVAAAAVAAAGAADEERDDDDDEGSVANAWLRFFTKPARVTRPLAFTLAGANKRASTNSAGLDSCSTWVASWVRA